MIAILKISLDESDCPSRETLSIKLTPSAKTLNALITLL
jgi:hypothetical protein